MLFGGSMFYCVFYFLQQAQYEGTQWGRPGPGGSYWRPSAVTGQRFFDKMVLFILFHHYTPCVPLRITTWLPIKKFRFADVGYVCQLHCKPAYTDLRPQLSNLCGNVKLSQRKFCHARQSRRYPTILCVSSQLVDWDKPG